MLSFEEFSQKIKNEIMQYMPQEYHDAVFGLVEINKQNDEKYTALVMDTAQKIAPNLYLESYYHTYQETEEIETILQAIAQKYLDAMKQGEEILGFDVNDYVQVKERLFLSVLNKENNEQYIKGHCYKEVPGTDLVAAVKVLCNGKDGEQATFMVNGSQLSAWGISEEGIYEQAFLNTPGLFPPELMNMKDVIKNLSLMEDMDPDLASLLQSIPEAEQADPFVLLPQEPYILGNDKKMNGATALLYQDTLQTIAERTGSNFFILPSSIHELILIKDTGDVDVEDLQLKVMDVNRTVLSPEDFLSDEIYCYDRQEQKIFMATDREYTKKRIEEYMKEAEMETEEER